MFIGGLRDVGLFPGTYKDHIRMCIRIKPWVALLRCLKIALSGQWIAVMSSNLKQCWALFISVETQSAVLSRCFVWSCSLCSPLRCRSLQMSSSRNVLNVSSSFTIEPSNESSSYFIPNFPSINPIFHIPRPPALVKVPPPPPPTTRRANGYDMKTLRKQVDELSKVCLSVVRFSLS